MGFISKLKPESKGMAHRMLKAIEFNNQMFLSIQASQSHYCHPRKTIFLRRYTHMEVAILSGKLNSSFKDWHCYPELDFLRNYWDNGVFAYVPVRQINEVYKHFKKIYGLKKESKNGKHH